VPEEEKMREKTIAILKRDSGASDSYYEYDIIQYNFIIIIIIIIIIVNKKRNEM
jgi:hypothetical protein